MIDHHNKPYVPLKYDRTGKKGPPMTPLQAHRARLRVNGLSSLTTEEEARIYPDEARTNEPHDR